jgi:hypothetical protein
MKAKPTAKPIPHGFDAVHADGRKVSVFHVSDENKWLLTFYTPCGPASVSTHISLSTWAMDMLVQMCHKLGVEAKS